MNKTKTIQLRIDADLKKDFESLCYKSRLNCSNAVTMLIDSCRNKNELPFELDCSLDYKRKNSTEESRIIFRIEEDKKRNFAKFCDERGLTMAVVIKSFMVQCIKKEKILL